MIKNIFFDFDGVIAESVNAKTEAFREMYLPYGEDIAGQVVDYHIHHGGISRFEKFRHWEKKFFNRELDQNQIDVMAQRFSSLVLQKVIDAEEVKGALAFIEKYHGQLNFWVITGTPTTEIEVICKKRGLSKYFIGLHGSPENKKHWTDYLLKMHNLKNQETLFLGDATTDYEAALHGNLHFALRETEENMKMFAGYEGVRFNDFAQLETRLIELGLLN
jgi:phosphoglycolate phosphatase-like HAD superfamily hydrolase